MLTWRTRSTTMGLTARRSTTSRATAATTATTANTQGFSCTGTTDSAGGLMSCRVKTGRIRTGRDRVQKYTNGTVLDLARTDPATFDSFVMLGNNLGLLGGADQAPEFLAALASMARPGARIVGETLNPYITTDPDHLRYHEANRRLGRMPGQLRLRVRDGHVVTLWWDYLLCTPEELDAVLAPTRWAQTDSYAGPSTAEAAGPAWPPGQWVAVLTLGP